MSTEDRKVIGKCEACDNELHGPGKEYWQQADYAEIPVAPGVMALCCAKGLGHHGKPSGSVRGACARRIRQKRGLCPGCGKHGPYTDMTWRGVLCDDCEATLARTRETETKKVEWYRILSAALVPHLSGDLVEQASRALAEAVAGARRWFPIVQETSAYPNHDITPNGSDHRWSHSTFDPIVEMDEAQAIALCRFLGFIYEIAEAQHAQGFEEGDNLLRRLAKGDVKPDEYEQWSAAKK